MTRIVPTPEQSAILAAADAPLRIAAGAGTGKTTTLALRIAALVTSAAESGTILGLTFTNKAAAELSTRVNSTVAGARQESDLEAIDVVDIKTYHGFAHSILEEFGAFVGVERGAGLITPTFARQIMSDAIDETPVTVLNTTWDQTVDLATQLAGRLAENLATPEQLAACGDPTQPLGLERIDYAKVIERFETAKRRLGVIDYGDLIGRAYFLVSRFPDIAARIRSRYRAVFLDEYQDTNPAQRMLLQTIFGLGFPITAVGDVDQTIYEWRGATPANFERFPDHFPDQAGEPAQSLPLSLNRRSGRRILEFANTIRGIVAARGTLDLTPVDGAVEGEVSCRWFATAVDEAGFIADEVLRMKADGLEWRDMAVLFRKNRSIELIRKTLEDADVPVEVANVGGLLDIPEIADVHAWLRILGHPGDHAALLRVLLGSRYRLGLGDIRPLADWIKSHNADAGDADLVHTLVEAAEHAPTIEGLEPRAVEALAEFTVTYRRLLEAAQGVRLVELVRHILSETGTWPEIEAMASASRQSARLNMYRFLDLAEEWSPLEGRPSLDTFLHYLRMMAAEDAEELSAAHLSGENAVALLTVHRAKGLEWEAVFVPTVYRENFPSKSQRFDDPFASATILPYELRIEGQPDPAVTADMTPRVRKDILRDRHNRSEWRLAYVAATRAKSRLWITGAWWYGHPTPTKNAKKKSDLYELAQASPVVADRGTAEMPEAPPGMLLPDADGLGPDPLFGDEGWSAAIRRLFADPSWAASRAAELGIGSSYDVAMDSMQEMLFSLPSPHEPEAASSRFEVSVTNLVTYSMCPKRYFWTAVDPLPRRPSTAATVGVEVHRRIELHNRGAIPLTDISDSLYDATSLDDAPKSRTGPGPFEVFEASRFAETQPLFVEAPFDLSLEGAAIRGRVDAIYPGWEIVDFKSGRSSNAEAADRQLEAYALAVADGAFGPRPAELAVTFAYLGGGVLEERSQAVDADWLATARSNLQTVVAGISDAAFDPTPGAACRSCDFVRFCEPGRAHLQALTESGHPEPRE